jgi:hypothetical protein
MTVVLPPAILARGHPRALASGFAGESTHFLAATARHLSQAAGFRLTGTDASGPLTG